MYRSYRSYALPKSRPSLFVIQNSTWQQQYCDAFLFEALMKPRMIRSCSSHDTTNSNVISADSTSNFVFLTIIQKEFFNEKNRYKIFICLSIYFFTRFQSRKN